MSKPYSPSYLGKAGGTIPFRDATLTNSVETMSALATNLYFLQLDNPTGAKCYFNMWDTVGAVTPGTTAITRQIVIPANGGILLDREPPMCFEYGIKYNVSTNVNGTGAPAADLVLSDAELFI